MEGGGAVGVGGYFLRFCLFRFSIGCVPSFKLILSLGLVKKFVVVVVGGGG